MSNSKKNTARSRAKVWGGAVTVWAAAGVLGVGFAVVAPNLLGHAQSSAAAPATVSPLGDAAHAAAAAAVTSHATTPSAAATPTPTPTRTPTPKVATPAAPAPAVPPDLPTGARLAAAKAAVKYANDRGWRSGIAIRDLVTGETTVAGDADGYFRTESTMKLFVAARLLADGTMSSADRPAARAMIARSDDGAANGFYGRVGGDGLVSWVGAHYGINGLGTPPVRGAGQWGSTQVSPRGMATFLDKAYHDPAVGPWLVDAMVGMTPTAADGTNQIFGLRAADPNAVVKQGWGGDADPVDVEGTPSVGFVDHGRYAVALYTTRLPESSMAEATAVVTAQAQLLMPGGQIPHV